MVLAALMEGTSRVWGIARVTTISQLPTQLRDDLDVQPDKLFTYFNQPLLEFSGRLLAGVCNGWSEGRIRKTY
jgi:hypothetical protein